ncbi:MAG TPA: MBL fold metallo-hydrolase [Chryseosolibacter sp.]|nr:MBL fold metallo-hydrolase [Chryseosolibacter sp.]
MDVHTLENFTAPVFTVAPGIWGRKELFVNFYIIQDHVTGNWVLVDAGLKWSAARIKNTARELFGENAKPAAIVLTHGHFDHVGALATLADEWDVPVYAHEMEMPFLNGKSAYPPADPTVGGGMMASMSWLYPLGPINLGDRLKPLPLNGTIPHMPEWKYIHTPGHSPGHVSLFRERDRVLIAGDAFVTTKAESLIYALTFMKHLSGPPKYLTCNWASAKHSAARLEALNPQIAVTGHGQPMEGEELRTELRKLVGEFDKVAVPAEGRYVNEPAVTNENGVVFLPPATEKLSTVIKVLGVALAVASVALVIYQQTKKKKKEPLTQLTDILKLQYN